MVVARRDNLTRDEEVFYCPIAAGRIKRCENVSAQSEHHRHHPVPDISNKLKD